MVDLILNLPSICGETPILLKSNSNLSVTFTQEQCAALLSCAFFCAFPNQQLHLTYRSVNFHTLFQEDRRTGATKSKTSVTLIASQHCLFIYFASVPDGLITFRRFCLPSSSIPAWSRSTARIAHITVTDNQKIEDMKNYLQVDFANKFIGGGVLNMGDNSGRRSIKCVAIDAIHFEQPEQQYTIANIERELVKSYCAFS
ncbi:unnamed protein product, partial [Didymodactylos carnosus]